MKLCSACNACVDGTAPTSNPSRGYWNQRLNVYEPFLQHHKTLQDLIAAARAACPPCLRLWTRLKLPDQLHHPSPDFQLSSALNVENDEECAVDAVLEQWILDLRMTKKFTSLLGSPNQSWCTVASFAFVASDTFSTTLPDESLLASSESTGDSGSMSLAKWWLSRCQMHTTCSGPSKRLSWMPTRLIEVPDGGNPGSFRLRHFGDSAKVEPYCTLSHAWGGANILRLVKDNVGTLEEGLNVDVLPNTFRDALNVCNALSVRLIWIDSLCIIQDDREDWTRESKQMSHVYNKALLNIAADASVDSYGGLFRSRHFTKITRSHHDVPELSSGRVPSGSYELIDRFTFAQIQQLPLNFRAWVYQERLLAQRVLHFTDTGLMWECQIVSATEAYPEGIPTQAMIDGMMKSLRGFRSYEAATWHTQDRCNLCREWNAIVMNFSNAKLTYLDDRPLAIAGLAKHMESLTKDRYVAGMWEKHLHAQLLWYTKGPDIRFGEPAHHLRRDFPSWSWLSLDSGVASYTTWAFDHMTELSRVVKIDLSEITMVSGRLIQTGRLHIRGILRSILLRPSKYPPADQSSWELIDPATALSTEPPPKGSDIPYIYPDATRPHLPPESKADEHFLLPLGSSRGHIACLIVERINAPVYRRVGMCALPIHAKSDHHERPYLLSRALGFTEENVVRKLDFEDERTLIELV